MNRYEPEAGFTKIRRRGSAGRGEGARSPRRRGRGAMRAALAGFALALLPPSVAIVPANEVAPGLATLGAPFDSWNVAVTPSSDAQVYELAFDSPRLGLRSVSHVYLPDAYLARTDPLPVAYFLHGTIRIYVAPGAAEVFEGLADGGVSFGYPFSPGNGHSPTRFVRESLDRAEYVIVTPDSGETAWCDHCFFVDGHEGAAPAAESHLHEELIPLVEAVFRVRGDRAGRAVFGRSMGGGAALIQGFRHPDRFAFVGALSPSHLDWIEDPLLSYVLWKHYLQGHGYPPPQVDELPMRNLNPVDLAPNTIGTNQEIVIILGDGCVDHSEGACEGSNAADDPRAYFFGAGQEIPLRRNADFFMPRLTELGAPITYVQREGLHGEINRDGYERYLLPRLNRLFAEGVPDPWRFSYKSADRRFGAWGYDFEVERPNEEFLNVLGARLDGRELVLAGTGTVSVRTPPAFPPETPHVVRIVPLSPVPPLGRPPVELPVVSDVSGRLSFTVSLAEPRPFDERRELVAEGVFDFPQTRIEVLE